MLCHIGELSLQLVHSRIVRNSRLAECSALLRGTRYWFGNGHLCLRNCQRIQTLAELLYVALRLGQGLVESCVAVYHPETRGDRVKTDQSQNHRHRSDEASRTTPASMKWRLDEA